MSSTMSEGRCPSDWALEQYFSGERDVDQDVSRHLASCARCRQQVERMKVLGNEYMTSDEANRLRHLLKQGADRAPERPNVLRGWGFPLIIAGVSFASVLPMMIPQRVDESTAEDDLAAKGVGRVLLWIETPDGPVPLGADVVPPNTRLQCGLIASQTGFVAGFVQDDEGIVRLFPEEPQAMPFSSRVPAALGPSFTVDDKSQSVTVLLYFSEQPFDVTGLEVSLRAGDGAPFQGAVFERTVDIESR